MNIKKMLISGALSVGILAGSSIFTFADSITYKVQPGDTFWKISQKYNVSLSTLMNANNASASTILYVGQNLTIPAEASQTTYTVRSGDAYWKIAAKYGVDINLLMSFNGANEKTVLYPGQKIKIPGMGTSAPSPAATKPYITYDKYTVQKGDTFWSVASKFGLPMSELLKANNANESSYLSIGDVIKIPVHHIPVKSTPGEKYGEYLDWWTEAQYVIPIGSVFEVVDFYTGKSFKAKRTTGANHADVETMTLEDTKTMKTIWGGNFSWTARPVIIKHNGRKIAASATSMPHAGNESAPGGKYTSWRSGNYGAGENYDWVKGNGIDGHFDIHFAGSTRHNNGQIDSKHQANVKIAAGVK
jgi:D-gamma-glutamyl-meso-diaminopimelic acid endopeptidase CwlS